MNFIKLVFFSLLIGNFFIAQSQDTESPTAPANLTYHDISHNSVRLTWDASDDNVKVTGYIIFDGTDSVTSINDIQITLTNLDPLTDYTFTVVAFDAAKNRSLASNVVDVRTLSIPDTQSPTAPGNLVSNEITTTSVLLSWDPSTDDYKLGGYIIYRGTDSIGNTPDTIIQYKAINLAPSTAYTFYVVAFDTADNRSIASNIVNVTTLTPDITPPTKPTGLTAHDTTTTGVRLTWNASTDNVKVAGYIVYRGSDSLTTVTSLEYIVSGLNPSTNYSFTVCAVDTAKNKSNASDAVIVRTLTAPDVTPPSIPGNLTPNDISINSIRLTWNASTDNSAMAGYIVYRGADSISQVSNLEYTVSGLSPGTRYHFSVRAKDAAGNKSLVSNMVDTLTLKDTQAPTAPAGLAASDTTNISVRLNWSASTDNVGVIAYVVYNGTDSVTTVATTQYIVLNLTASTSYTFSVKAKDAAGNKSSSSAVINVTTKANPDLTNPTAPTNLSASNITANSVKISWGAATDNVGISGYIIYRGVDSLTTVSALEYTLTGLSSATNYTFSVRARDAAGNKSTAIAIGIITASDILAPSTPSNLAGNNITTSSVRLTWNASTDNVGVSGYVIYRNSDSLTTVTALEYTAGGLTLGTSYNFSVRAKDAVGNKSAAATITIITASDITIPTAPGNLAASNITTSSVRLTWGPATDNIAVTGYIIIRGASEIATINALEFTVTGLTPATAYNFSVKAIDAAGNKSESSNQVNITTQNPPDVISPSSPGNLSYMSITDTSVYLYWIPATDNIAVTGYILYKDSDSIAFTSETEFAVHNLSASTRYAFYIKAVDAAGNISIPGNSVTIRTHLTPDKIAPTAPSDLMATDTGSTTVFITWLASTDNLKVTGYRIYVNDSLVKTTPATNCLITGLYSDSTYIIYVFAHDAAANLSDTSDIIQVTTLHGSDLTAPPIPEGLLIYDLTDETISFRWEPSSDVEDLLGYQVYVNENLLTTTTLTEFSIIDLLPNTIYTFYIRAVDSAGNVSGPSIKISATTDGIVGIDGIPQLHSLIGLTIDNRTVFVRVPYNLMSIESAEIYSSLGQLMYYTDLLQDKNYIHSEQGDFKKGVYILVLRGNNFRYSVKFLY